MVCVVVVAMVTITMAMVAMVMVVMVMVAIVTKDGIVGSDVFLRDGWMVEGGSGHPRAGVGVVLGYSGAGAWCSNSQLPQYLL